MREAFVDSTNIERDIDFFAQESGAARKALEDLHLTSGYTSLFDIGKEDSLEVYYQDVVRRNNYFQQLSNFQIGNTITTGTLKDFEQYAEMRNLTNDPNKRPYRVPSGISIYPHNTLYLWWSILSIVSFAFGVLGFIVFFDERG